MGRNGTGFVLFKPATRLGSWRAALALTIDARLQNWVLRVSLEVAVLCAPHMLAWLLQALFSVCSVNYSGRAAHSVSEGQHPLEVTGVNIIFLERSIQRQKCFCLGAASDIVCSLNTFFQNIIVAQNIQAQTELVFMPCCQLTCVLDVTLPARISGVA